MICSQHSSLKTVYRQEPQTTTSQLLAFLFIYLFFENVSIVIQIKQNHNQICEELMLLDVIMQCKEPRATKQVKLIYFINKEPPKLLDLMTMLTKMNV